MSSSNDIATTALRRSQLYRRHIEMGAVFEALSDGTAGDSAVVSHYRTSEEELTQAQHLGLADLSTLPRMGFKGLGTPGWAAAQGIELPAQPNQATLQTDGTLVARLSQSELLLASNLNGLSESIESFANTTQSARNSELPERVYSLPRSDSHSWLVLCGSRAAETLAKVCGVDLRPHKFANGEVAQTSIAKINGVLVRNDLGETLSYCIFSDSSSVEFLWDSLHDAMAEFKGAAIGIQALRDC
jgi:sarcosine oxidase subunit gamma